MNYLEAIRIEQGTPLLLEYHRKRMFQTTGCTLPSFEIPSDMKEGRVKCRIVYNKEVLSIDFTRYTIPEIRTLRIVTHDTIDYSVKYENRSVINSLFEQRKECDDILIVKNGFITDTSFCNIVFENKGELYTPKVPLLAGTQRAYLLNHKIIHPIDINLEMLSCFDRAFLINAMIDLTDYVSMDVAHIFY